MARQKKEDPPKGSAPWMNTFADLMNLLLCFFVLLFSMSTVDAEKFEMVIASLQSSFSILPSGGASIGDGQMISAGVSQLELLDEYYKKRKSAQLIEAKELAQLYIERYGKEPDEKAFHEFFWLFSDANDELPECWSNMMKLGENYAYTMERFRENKKQFKNMSDFLNKLQMGDNQ